MEWMMAVSKVLGGQVIAIDGKVVRRSHDKGIGKAAIDMVSAWATANHLVLGQVKVDEKSNEITAIPQFLETPWKLPDALLPSMRWAANRGICREDYRSGSELYAGAEGQPGQFV